MYAIWHCCSTQNRERPASSKSCKVGSATSQKESPLKPFDSGKINLDAMFLIVEVVYVQRADVFACLNNRRLKCFKELQAIILQRSDQIGSASITSITHVGNDKSWATTPVGRCRSCCRSMCFKHAVLDAPFFDHLVMIRTWRWLRLCLCGIVCLIPCAGE